MYEMKILTQPLQSLTWLWGVRISVNDYNSAIWWLP